MARRSFEVWKAAVNAAVERLAGLSADDLPDAPYADWWERGVSPVSAAKRAIRAAGGENPGRRRVKRGKTAKRRRNPVVYPERKAWQAVETISKRLAAGKADRDDGVALRTLAEQMRSQLARSVHVNPTLAVFGANPPTKAGILSNEVQAVMYRHAADGKDYVHPFGKGVRVVNKRDGSTVVRAAVSARSGVRATLLSDGSVLLRHPTKPLWGDM